MVHIIEETKNYLKERCWKNPLILCSTTAAANRLHARYFSCQYPVAKIQREIEDLILAVTAGCPLKEASSHLSALISQNESVVLGCTELSVIHEAEFLNHPKVCNPNQLIEEKVCALACRIPIEV